MYLGVKIKRNTSNIDKITKKLISIAKENNLDLVNFKSKKPQTLETTEIYEFYFDLSEGWTELAVHSEENYAKYDENPFTSIYNYIKDIKGAEMFFTSPKFVEEYPVFRVFEDDMLNFEFIFPKSKFTPVEIIKNKEGTILYLYRDVFKINIYNKGDHEVKLRQINESLAGFRLENVLGESLIELLGKEFESPEEKILGPNETLSETINWSLKFEQKGIYTIYPLTSHFETENGIKQIIFGPITLKFL
ncbi:MAG: hypothetical protein ACTSU2_07845 [Promethearchaeota archaeon]